MSEPTKCVCGHEAWEHEDRLCMGDNLACGCDGFAATPLPAPDPKARDRSYWRKVVKDAYDLHQFPIGFEETQARLDAMARDLDDAHSAAPHGEAVAWLHDLPEGELFDDERDCQLCHTLDEAQEELRVHGGTITPLFTHPAPAARVTSEMVERGARALHAGLGTSIPWEDLFPSMQNTHRSMALDALTAALSARTGGTE